VSDPKETRTVRGWLFDLYPSRNGITLWLIDERGNAHRCWDEFHPSFFLSLDPAEIGRAEAQAARCPVRITTKRIERRELYANQDISVLHLFIHNPTDWRKAISFFENLFPHYAFFNSDIPPAQLYLYDTQLFPLAHGEYSVAPDGRLASWRLDDDIDRVEYALPPVTIMGLRNANDFVPPKYHQTLRLELSYDGKTYGLEQEDERELLGALNHHLRRHDPDIVITQYGDATLLPTLQSLSEKHKIPLLLNRDESVGYFRSKDSSFFQYGKVIHKEGAFELAGRWHIDAENSFTVAEADLDGLFEIARITQIPPQHQARASIGTGLSSRQLSWAYRHNILIPAKKREPEEFKSAATLLLADRGGLVFIPPMGYHEEVAELDFVSMYPTIMVEHNVSPETINCRCCTADEAAAVPELGYRVCTKREGIVPATLRSVVARRSYYKQKKKELKRRGDPLWTRYDHRQNALKWMLVTCFGYLGYKNARFGRIEAHESVNAFSRDAILHAKEIAEEHGYHILHAIIDCMWMKRDGATEEDYEHLCREIGERVGIDISLEGIYRWIVFPASKTDPAIPTANRYAGWYRHEEMKIRGVEVRRHDTPKFVKTMQSEMLERMSSARNVDDVRKMVPALLDIAAKHIGVLRSGNANPTELVIRRDIRREPEEYTNNSISAIVSRLIDRMGVRLSAGESIEFIIVDQSGKKKPEKAKPLALYAFEDGYDIEKYTEFCLKAVETLLFPLGYDVKKLKEQFGLQEKPRGRRKPKACRSVSTTIPLFSDTEA
jgi:DNA polymerase-2